MKKDKQFFFAAATAKEDLLVEPGEVAEFVLDDTSTQQTLKLDWSINPSNTLTAHYRHEDLEIGEPGGSGSLKTNPGAFSREFEEVPYWRVGFQSVLGSNTVIEANFSDTINNRRTCSIPPSSFPPLSRSLAVFRKAMSVAGSSATTTSCPRSLSTVRYG